MLDTICAPLPTLSASPLVPTLLCTSFHQLHFQLLQLDGALPQLWASVSCFLSWDFSGMLMVTCLS